MAMQIRGTVTPNDPPTGLQERQLSVEMGSMPPKLWVGVPITIDPSGRLQLLPQDLSAYVTTAALTTALADYLSLVGGTLTPVSNNIALDINNTGTGDSLRIRNGATDHFVIAADGTITLSAQAVASLQAALGI